MAGTDAEIEATTPAAITLLLFLLTEAVGRVAGRAVSPVVTITTASAFICFTDCSLGGGFPPFAAAISTFFFFVPPLLFRRKRGSACGSPNPMVGGSSCLFTHGAGDRPRALPYAIAGIPTVIAAGAPIIGAPAASSHVASLQTPEIN